jgi:hypothetical protein
MVIISWTELFARHMKSQTAIPFHRATFWKDAASMFKTLEGITPRLRTRLEFHNITWDALTVTYDPKVLHAIITGWEHETVVGPTDDFMEFYGITDANDSVDEQFLNPDLVLHTIYNEGGV